MPHAPLRPLDYHVLVVLAEKPLYGYAIMKAVAAESQQALTPEIGSLYRVLARLQDQGFLTEVIPPEDAEIDSPIGRLRRYYGITPEGLGVLRAETERVARVVARARSVLAGESGP